MPYNIFKAMPSIITENPKVPQALESVVLRATAKKLTDRYVSTYQMIDLFLVT